MYELARAPMSPSGRKTGGYRARSMRPAIAIGAGSRMISAWVPALDHRHPTYSLPRRLAKLIHRVRNRRDPYRRPLIQPRAQSRHATSCPAICRKRSGTSMTTNSTNCYPRSLPSRSDGVKSSPLKSPSRRRVEVVRPLTQGKLNAVRAAFKAGITLSRIARQFGISQSDVRKALASGIAKR